MSYNEYAKQKVKVHGILLRILFLTLILKNIKYIVIQIRIR